MIAAVGLVSFGRSSMDQEPELMGIDVWLFL